MSSHARRLEPVSVMAVLCVLICTLNGCARVGPLSVSEGRPAYNEAINRTDNEQLLSAIVRHRYGETYGMLAVAGVTANLRFSGEMGIQRGFGDDEDFAGNLVPFSAGISYEENPTISYVPVEGEQYVRQLMSPIPLDLMILFVRSMSPPGPIFTMLVSRVNDLKNPDFLPSPSARPDPGFIRFVELMAELFQTGNLYWVADPEREDEFSMVIRGYSPTFSEEVGELLHLLGISEPGDESKTIVLPIVLAVEGTEKGEIAVTTRSVYDLAEILSARIDVPEEHVQSGLATCYPPVGLAGSNVCIRRSQKRPVHASVAVPYRGSWFYVDETDRYTKASFRLLDVLWRVRIASGTDKIKAAPVLTVPVTR